MFSFDLNIISSILEKDEDLSQIKIQTWCIENDILPPGNNFGSVPTWLHVEYEKAGKMIKKRFFCKLYPEDSVLRELHIIFHLYKKEFLMYNTVLPEMRKLQHSESIVPKYYQGNDTDYLVIEDLLTLGYKMTEKSKQLDLEHCKIFFQNLGQFHGYSVKLNKISAIPDGIKEEILLKNLLQYEKYSVLYQKGINLFIDNLPADFKNKYSAKLSHYKEHTLRNIIPEINGTENTFKVLNHGDCWSPNILFKYDESNAAEKLKFVDFQLCVWASPALDILKFTITSMKYEIFEHHFDTLLELYLANLNEILTIYEIDPFQIEDLRRHLDGIQYHIILLLSIFLPQCLAKPDIYFDPDNISLGDVVLEAEAKKLLDENQFQIVPANWLSYYTRKGLFDDQ